MLIQIPIPQGSVLGPLLCLTYINDMSKVVQYSEMNHFADETNFLYQSNSIKKLNRYINHRVRFSDPRIVICGSNLPFRGSL